MKSDRFWEIFWLSFFALAITAVMGSGSLFFYHISKLNAASVGVAFDPNKDPFEQDLYRTKTSLANGFVYRDSLPVGVSPWVWDTTPAWHSSEQVFEGASSIKMQFNKPWAGVGVQGFAFARDAADSLRIAVYPDAQVGDLYVELYDAAGHALPRQSLGWYASGGTLKPNEWQEIVVPLQNLLGGSTTARITGLSLSTINAGVAYADSIQFTHTGTTHPIWVEPSYTDAPPFNPFATSTPISLPYRATFTADDFARWYSYYGSFMQKEGAFAIGPEVDKHTDSIATFRGGITWSDYKVDATLDWGLTSVFSLLVRMTDPENFASCAFSYYGQTVQIYQVQNGASTQLAQSPTLPTKFDAPWEDVRVGASVSGNRVSCYLDGKKVLSADMPTLASRGTVGLEAWDQNSYASPHAVKSFEVTPLLGE